MRKGGEGRAGEGTGEAGCWGVCVCECECVGLRCVRWRGSIRAGGGARDGIGAAGSEDGGVDVAVDEDEEGVGREADEDGTGTAPCALALASILVPV